MSATEEVTALKGRFPLLCTQGLTGAVQGLNYLIAYADDHEVEACIDTCVEWLALCNKVSVMVPGRDSYSYKHEVEQWAKRPIPHFAMLVAAQRAGLSIEPSPRRLWAAQLNLGARRPGALS